MSIDPRRHHYIPQFYLRGFANTKRQVRVYTPPGGASRIASVRDAAVQSGFYDLTDEYGIRSTAAERALSRIEDEAAGALKRLTLDFAALTDADRKAVAILMAFMLVRTPELRDWNRRVDHALRELLAAEGSTEEDIEGVFERSGISSPTQNQDVLLSFHVADEIARALYQKQWIIGRSVLGGLVTSDHPVVNYTANPDPLRGTGVENADEVHFPLDRYHTLMMVSRSLPVTVLELEPDNVLFCNALIASWSYRHVFQYPDDSPLGEVMPQDERSLGSMNERELRPVNKPRAKLG